MRPARVLAIIAVAIATTSCTSGSTPTPVVVRETVEVTRLVQVTTTAEPLPTGTPLGRIILTDNFDGGAGSWRIDTTADYSAEIRDGMLVVSVLSPNVLYRVGHPDLDFFNSPFDLELRVDFIGGYQGSYAAIDFRYNDEYNFATFFVNGAGFVASGAVMGGQFFEHMPWIQLPSVSLDSNTFRLIDHDERFTAYANGELLIDYPFPYRYLPLGSIGISVATYEEGSASWGFDDFSIRRAGR